MRGSQCLLFARKPTCAFHPLRTPASLDEIGPVIELKSFPSIEANLDGPQLVLWMGEPFDFSTPFRRVLAEIMEALGPESGRSLQIPTPEQGEDFIDGSFRFDGKLVEVYWEHSLSYLSLRPSDIAALHDIADRIRPLIVISP